MKKIKSIPTILGLILISMGLITGIVLLRQNSNWLLHASPETTPRQVKITNIADNSFTVSWITESPTSGFVKYSQDQNLSLVTQDDRDQMSGTTNKYLTHHATLKNLNPATPYFFEIGSDKKIFNNVGEPYKVNTAPVSQGFPPASDIAHGSVVDTQGIPVSGAIIYLSLANTVSQSTLTKESGNWTISLNLARSADLNDYSQYDKNRSTEEIFVQAGAKGTAVTKTMTANDSPVPEITLGQSYDFQNSQSNLSTPQPTPSVTSRFSFEKMSPSQNLSEPLNVEITNPGEGEIVTTTKPALMGVASPNQTISITVESSSLVSGSTKADKDGEWTWSPSKELGLGKNKIKVSYFDENGKKYSLTRNFVIKAAGKDEDSPSFEATISGKLTPTPSGRISQPSTSSGVPSSGFSIPTYLFLALGLVLTGLGFLIII